MQFEVGGEQWKKDDQSEDIEQFLTRVEIGVQVRVETGKHLEKRKRTITFTILF